MRKESQEGVMHPCSESMINLLKLQTDVSAAGWPETVEQGGHLDY